MTGVYFLDLMVFPLIISGSFDSIAGANAVLYQFEKKEHKPCSGKRANFWKVMDDFVRVWHTFPSPRGRQTRQ